MTDEAFVIASDPPSLAARATAGLRSAEARRAKAEAKQSRATCKITWIASSPFGLLAMTVCLPYSAATAIGSARAMRRGMWSQKAETIADIRASAASV
jgi:hypothetical protein